MYTVYKITNTINGKFYIGVHKTEHLTDSYMGSGLAIKQAIAKYGRNNFTKEVLHVFASSADAYSMERVLLSEVWEHYITYNMKPGGVGGWEAWNMSRDPNDNPMKRPDVVERNRASKKKTIEANKKRFADIARQNLLKAVEANTGKSRPDHSIRMIEQGTFRKMWEDKESVRDKMSSNWELISPSGQVYNTNRLEDFCKQYGLTYVSVWETHRSGKPVKKGKSKGWICRKNDEL